MDLFTVLVIGVVAYIFIGMLFVWWVMVGAEDALDGITSQLVRDSVRLPLPNQILAVTLWPVFVLIPIIFCVLGKISSR